MRYTFRWPEHRMQDCRVYGFCLFKTDNARPGKTTRTPTKKGLLWYSL